MTERFAEGKTRRKLVPRVLALGLGSPPPGRSVDPVEVLVEFNRQRITDLVRLRHRRMLASPFAFLRGSALVMAHDLATTPASGLTVQLAVTHTC